jgi:threonine dehydrogenase-like Zn-dependent dehydrogenase
MAVPKAINYSVSEAMVDIPSSSRRFMMKAPLQFHDESVFLDAAAEKDYLVRVDVCGLCRSDLHSAADWASDWAEEGHEFGGTIIAVRRRDGKFRLGQRVAVRNASPCRECPACRNSRPKECTNLVVNKQGYREYSECDERSLVDARGLDDELLALVEPANVALELLDAAQIGPCDRVLVLGAGTLGLIASHFSRVLKNDVPRLLASRQPQPLAALLGIPVCEPIAKINRNVLQSHLGGLPSVVLVTTPPTTLPLAFEFCAPGGRILTIGLDKQDSCTVPVNVQTLIFKRLSLQGVFACPNLNFEQAIAALRAHGEALRLTIRHRIRRDELESYFRAWHRGEGVDGKAVLLRSP